MTSIVQHVSNGEVCCDQAWERAYRRFETPEQEVQKFIHRLKKLDIEQGSSDRPIVELFCGRGGGLVALEKLGFTQLTGVDLSLSLLEQYRGPAQLHLADCRDLPFEQDSFDTVIVQGGLHHLPTLPDDLDRVFSEIARILKPEGKFYVVEPWMTPFLRVVHAIVEQPIVRRFYKKGDALAEMIQHERQTYEQWLGQPESILEAFSRSFRTIKQVESWGKLRFVGQPR